MTTRYKEREQVWAVLRYDNRDCEFKPELDITVKEIVRSADLAKSEADRLNSINKDKRCFYWATLTRLFPEGASFGTSPGLDMTTP